MRKILTSVFVIALMAGATYAATSAFFSDVETSRGNVLAAGAIDLQIDNTSYYGWNEDGTLRYSEDTSWKVKNLEEGDLFFNFLDLKPGDLGEDTISLHVDDNPAWVCVDIDITANDDVSSNEPELEDGDDEEDEQDDFDGELAQNLDFIFWWDDGDNVLEVGETVLTDGYADSILDGVTWALADSTTQLGPLTGGETYYIGKAWCFGDIAPNPVTQDNSGFLGAEGKNGPDTRGPGVSCSGADQINNLAQTDRLEADVSFRAVQSRNNLDFVCERPVEPAQSRTGDGWASVGGNFDESWQADARYGDGGTTAAENEVRVGLPGGGSPIVQSHTDNTSGEPWVSGETYTFKLNFDGTDAVWTVEGVSVDTGTVAHAPLTALGVLGLTAKTNDADATIVVDNVLVNGIAPVGPDGMTASGVGDKEFLLLTGIDFSSGFTLSGEFTPTFTTPLGNEDIGLLVQVD